MAKWTKHVLALIHMVSLFVAFKKKKKERKKKEKKKKKKKKKKKHSDTILTIQSPKSTANV